MEILTRYLKLNNFCHMKQSNLWPKLFPLNDRAYFVHTTDDYMSMLQMYRRDIELSTNTSSVNFYP